MQAIYAISYQFAGHKHKAPDALEGADNPATAINRFADLPQKQDIRTEVVESPSYAVLSAAIGGVPTPYALIGGNGLESLSFDYSGPITVLVNEQAYVRYAPVFAIRSRSRFGEWQAVAGNFIVALNQFSYRKHGETKTVKEQCEQYLEVRYLGDLWIDFWGNMTAINPNNKLCYTISAHGKFIGFNAKAYVECTEEERSQALSDYYSLFYAPTDKN